MTLTIRVISLMFAFTGLPVSAEDSTGTSEAIHSKVAHEPVSSTALYTSSQPSQNWNCMQNRQKFSIGISGSGYLMDVFQQAARLRFPAMKVYDRNEEARREASDVPIPRHPKVADVDVLFQQQGSLESVTIRSAHRHRYFNYDPSDLANDTTRRSLLLNQMTQTLCDMLNPPL